MEIQQLKGFHAVARFGNFTLAAEKTCRSQPAISLQIKALEEELGVQLFERIGHKKVLLTDEGKLFLELTEKVVGELDLIREKFDQTRGIFSSSSITIATHQAVMNYCLPQVIKSFRDRFPECHLSILNRSREEAVKALHDGEIDLGITSLEAVPSFLRYTPFARFNRLLIGCAGHPLSKVKKLTLQDIAQFPLIVPPAPSQTRTTIDRVFEEQGISHKVAMEVASRSAIKTYAVMNLGISIINDYFVSPEDREKLFVKDVTELFGQSETGFLVHKDRSLSAPCLEFVKLLVTTIAGGELSTGSNCL